MYPSMGHSCDSAMIHVSKVCSSHSSLGGDSCSLYCWCELRPKSNYNYNQDVETVLSWRLLTERFECCRISDFIFHLTGPATVASTWTINNNFHQHQPINVYCSILGPFSIDSEITTYVTDVAPKVMLRDIIICNILCFRQDVNQLRHGKYKFVLS